ncbi:MAG TPA: hypothetical protein DCY48_02160 [Candidatus Magasanikbacteria bacterium]|nr:MAG: hypothetical protein A3I74_01070 [Candidatus Magasanikbacteria bacterium RIFCSPLOWO2_02_FULL_47_16]OGH79964.1 MAG: hypothetical protein A3C10_02155 [Candidatus Magasanikbacteria bacterium RIFCSPHIGHO2_02_FULL_48_18]OGH82976.1 MAG: hypothetical protein A3G08_03640 [Candidatus Magasanikbacteria bacterium RIFCSPLOWO2_12_FULL_47_9b]HAZ28560.1 hypothetical protein [Candidatus Magasanikbacteria bacterium]
MKSLERRYKNIAQKYTGWGSYICFAKAVTGQHFSRRAIQHWFNKLVDKNDYCKSDKAQLLKHLESLTKSTEDGTE